MGTFEAAWPLISQNKEISLHFSLKQGMAAQGAKSPKPKPFVRTAPAADNLENVA